MRSTRIRSAHAGRVSNAELRREAIRVIELAQGQHMIFLAVLAQRGGSVTVTEGTINQIGTELKFYDYRVRDGLHPGESIVELVDSRKKHEDADGKSTDRSRTGDAEAGTGSGPDSAGGDRGPDSGTRGPVVRGRDFTITRIADEPGTDLGGPEPGAPTDEHRFADDGNPHG